METSLKKSKVFKTPPPVGTMTEAKDMIKFYHDWAFELLETALHYRNRLTVALDSNQLPCYTASDFLEAERKGQWTIKPRAE